jgi:hypothetical protein
LNKPNDKILSILPLLISRAIQAYFDERLTESLFEIFGIFGHKNECYLLIYQFVLQKFNGSFEMPLSTVDKLISKFLCEEK